MSRIIRCSICKHPCNVDQRCMTCRRLPAQRNEREEARLAAIEDKKPHFTLRQKGEYTREARERDKPAPDLVWENT
jgi:hypothetical protein